jgi:hypothetical protein
MGKPQLLIIRFVILLFIILIGCSSKTSQPILVPSLSLTISVTTKSPQELTTIFSTLTFTPWIERKTLTPSITVSPTKNHTLTLTPSPTVIVPTKSREGQNEFAFARLKQEPGCQLPCWWATRPGITRWDTVESNFLQNGIAPQKYKTSYELQWTKIPLRDKFVSFGIIYYLRSLAEPVVDAISLGAQMSNKNSLIWSNEIYNLFSSFRLDAMLSNYGRPESVRIYTSGKGNEDGQIFYSLALNYRSVGVSILYEGIAFAQGDSFLLCPNNTSLNIFLWDPERSDPSAVTAGKISSFIPVEYIDLYQDLNKVTRLTLDDFFDTFSRANNDQCISSPIDNWRK